MARPSLPLMLFGWLAACGSRTSPAEIAGWIGAHNQVRKDAQPAPAPPLSPLGWSDAAAQLAQAWASGCSYAHNPNRGPRGESIAAGTVGYLDDAGAVKLWAGEAPDYDYASDQCAAGKVCGHYLQLVARVTQRVGCAHQRCEANSPFGKGAWDFFVCDYEPSRQGGRPY